MTTRERMTSIRHHRKKSEKSDDFVRPNKISEMYVAGVDVLSTNRLAKCMAFSWISVSFQTFPGYCGCSMKLDGWPETCQTDSRFLPDRAASTINAAREEQHDSQGTRRRISIASHLVTLVAVLHEMALR